MKNLFILISSLILLAGCSPGDYNGEKYEIKKPMSQERIYTNSFQLDGTCVTANQKIICGNFTITQLKTN